METVRIGNKAGVPSVPNALSKVESYSHLRQVCERAGIGNDLVIQTAFGDSGHTTFFIANADDFARHADEIATATRSAKSPICLRSSSVTTGGDR